MELPVLIDDAGSRLSQVATQWTLLAEAQGAVPAGAPAAWRALMHRYCGAAYRYLAGAVRNEEVALELFQEFAIRFLRGDFHRADPAKGRFRDYVRAALVHLVTDHYRQLKNRPQPLPDDLAAPQHAMAESATDGNEFVTSWRDELIDRTWRALSVSQPHYQVILAMHARQPEILARELAIRLSEEFHRPITAANARVMLHRARHRFAELLIQEVEYSLENPSREMLVKELKALRLWSICNVVVSGDLPAAQEPREE